MPWHLLHPSPLTPLNTSQRPQCLHVFAMTALLRLSLLPVLVSDSAGVCHFQAFSPFYLLFILGVFFLSSLVYAPSSPSQLLTLTCLCQHNSLAVFSHSHSSLSLPVDDPVDLSCLYFCPARGSESQGRGVISSLRSVLSLLPPACPAASCHHQPSPYCSLYCSRTSSLTIVLPFPLLFHET